MGQNHGFQLPTVFNWDYEPGELVHVT